MSVLTDDQWRVLKEALDHARSGRGRPMNNERRTVEAIVWRLQNGARWRALPAEFGPWARAAHLHLRWSKLGVWQRAFEYLRAQGRPDLAEIMLDATTVRAHKHAAGAKGGA